MEFYEAVRRRRSVRKYKNDPVPDEVITRCLEAARLAPSWRNGQPWHFVVVRDRQTIARLTRANYGAGVANLWLNDVPVVIVACGEPRLSGKKADQSMYLVDVAAALEHVVLAATAEGLGTCWVGAFSEEKVRAVLGVPDRIRVVALTPLGYPADEKGLYDQLANLGKRQRPRRTLDEIIHYDTW